jgi:hypothetical protein
MHKKGHSVFSAGKWIMMVFFPVFFFIPQGSFPCTNYPLGSRAAAMGNAAVTTSDLWSVHHNQAGLASVSAIHAGFHYENKFLVPDLGLQAVALAVPASPGTLGLSYTYFGISRYYESKLGLAFGRMFGKRISAGIGINYLYTYIAEDYGDSGRPSVEGGFITQPFDGVFVAAHIYNPTRAKNIVPYGVPFPSVMRMGIAAVAGERILAAVEAMKESGRKTVFRAGLEMGFQGSFYLRAGVASEPVQTSFGLGYIHGKLLADLAFTNHQQLGYSPHISISYILR